MSTPSCFYIYPAQYLIIEKATPPIICTEKQVRKCMHCYKYMCHKHTGESLVFVCQACYNKQDDAGKINMLKDNGYYLKARITQLGSYIKQCDKVYKCAGPPPWLDDENNRIDS